jgi:hypothetical protein
MTPEEYRTLREEIKGALKNCPPWHRGIIGSDGKVTTVRDYPMPPKDLCGEPGNGKLCDLSRKVCQVLHGGNKTSRKEIYK